MFVLHVMGLLFLRVLACRWNLNVFTIYTLTGRKPTLKTLWLLSHSCVHGFNYQYIYLTVYSTIYLLLFMGFVGGIVEQEPFCSGGILKSQPS